MQKTTKSQADASPGLHARTVTKKFGSQMVFQNLDLDIAPGEFVAVIGPSGSGKTTLLNLLSGLDTPTSGDINAPSRRQRAFIFQDYNLLEALNARHNAELTSRLIGRKVSKAVVDRTFRLLGIESLKERLPHQLSGGQQQRVAVARAVIAEVPYIFADEPTGALDDTSASAVLDCLGQAAQQGSTVVMVTHSQAAAARADRIIDLGRVSAWDVE
ncbi:ABC transporter ATP-binding protein [Corynebacterium sp. 32222D000AT]|nr:ATP-binding cassette domain-containing protein [Mycobacteriaceae bacterium]MDY5829193.1 ATP-binding cassette domain-containing protein [Corynebacterium sp.]